MFYRWVPPRPLRGQSILWQLDHGGGCRHTGFAAALGWCVRDRGGGQDAHLLPMEQRGVRSDAQPRSPARSPLKGEPWGEQRVMDGERIAELGGANRLPAEAAAGCARR